MFNGEHDNVESLLNILDAYYTAAAAQARMME